AYRQAGWPPLRHGLLRLRRVARHLFRPQDRTAGAGQGGRQHAAQQHPLPDPAALRGQSLVPRPLRLVVSPAGYAADLMSVEKLNLTGRLESVWTLTTIEKLARSAPRTA